LQPVSARKAMSVGKITIKARAIRFKKSFFIESRCLKFMVSPGVEMVFRMKLGVVIN
jgi:hypothetical protein